MAINIIFGTIVLIGFIVGIKLMQSPNTAVLGNRLGALSMAAGFIYALLEFNIYDEFIFWLFLIIGAAIGAVLAIKVEMIQMPQTVALFNGFGGAASAFVALTSAMLYPAQVSWFFYQISALALAVGVMTFWGSIVAAGKLQGWFAQHEVHIRNHNGLLTALLLIGAVLVIFSSGYGGLLFNISWPFIFLIFALYGFFMAIRIGGADMPVLIAFLNSFSGIAAAISGIAIQHVILIGAGSLVGVAGLILTGIMCRAMNRSLIEVLRGTKPDAAHETDTVTDTVLDPNKQGKAKKEVSPLNQASKIITKAKSVVVVPGYGLAVAQAQKELKSLIDYLESNNTEVKLAIHPVAGRMPGHMNVLLAEVGIDYDKLWEMDSINPEFPETDAVLVVGACDVVNPEATNTEGTPISGMPILEAYKAKNVIVCNLDDSPGYSGVENTLYQQENVTAIWGDARENIDLLYKKLTGEEEMETDEEGIGVDSQAPSNPVDYAKDVFTEAKKTIVVPGYGLAVAQAQQELKSLIDYLESNNTEVKLAVHPVAGRMPGHMNVLLAEVGIDYDKLWEMDSINPEFPETDAVLVVGACDVINPEATNTEGTPISGMPILEAYKAKNVIVCNLDDSPGYSGVENTLYQQENVTAIWGDAKESLIKINSLLKEK